MVRIVTIKSVILEKSNKNEQMLVTIISLSGVWTDYEIGGSDEQAGRFQHLRQC